MSVDDLPAGSHDLESALHALADPRRRAMLALVFDREMGSGDLAEAAGLSKPSASQHLKLLRESGLMQVRVDANRRLYRADNERVAVIARQLDEYWSAPLARLGALAAAEHRATRPTSRRKRASA